MGLQKVAKSGQKSGLNRTSRVPLTLAEATIVEFEVMIGHS